MSLSQSDTFIGASVLFFAPLVVTDAAICHVFRGLSPHCNMCRPCSPRRSSSSSLCPSPSFSGTPLPHVISPVHSSVPRYRQPSFLCSLPLSLPHFLLSPLKTSKSINSSAKLTTTSGLSFTRRPSSRRSADPAESHLNLLLFSGAFELFLAVAVFCSVSFSLATWL